MFGDAGHGLILTIVAAAMVIGEKKQAKTSKQSEVSSVVSVDRPRSMVRE